MYNHVRTTGQFTRNINGSSNILSCNRCYRLQPLLTALVHVVVKMHLWPAGGTSIDNANCQSLSVGFPCKQVNLRDKYEHWVWSVHNKFKKHNH